MRGNSADNIEIQVGREESIMIDSGGGVRAPMLKTVLKFETFTSPVQQGIDTAVGSISDLRAIKTIRIKLSKVVGEKLFR
jgi:hypothetical protein